MTGAEHYREAEGMLAVAQDADEGARPGYRYADLIAEAQVHATLALAAATALPIDSLENRAEWLEVLSS
jgi:hypothetical protein